MKWHNESGKLAEAEHMPQKVRMLGFEDGFEACKKNSLTVHGFWKANQDGKDLHWPV